ncbi:MAG: hypothetical protein PVF56_18275 [Desulfobacterales bacterium]
MPKMDVEQIEEALRKEVQKLDKRVRVAGVEPGKKKDTYRVTLVKDGRSANADLQKDVIEQYLSREGKNKGLKKALGKAVSHLSIRYTR